MDLKSHLKQTALPELTKFGETTTKISELILMQTN